MIQTALSIAFLTVNDEGRLPARSDERGHLARIDGRGLPARKI